MVVSAELQAQILRYYHVEKWRAGTIARQIGVHRDVVARVLAQSGLPAHGPMQRPMRIDPYLPFILKTLEAFPTLTAARLYAMVYERGYRGHPDHFRHLIARHRPRPSAEAYLRLRALPGEEAQVDWGHFGHLQIGRARRPLMAFVMVLSYSRRLFPRFFLDARMDAFLTGHALAFEAFGAVPRVVLYDNLKSAVLERRGEAIRFNPTLLAFAGHYRFDPRPVGVARGNEKGRVERAIRYIRDNFFAARVFTDIDDLNAQAMAWCEGPAADRPCPGEALSVREAFAVEAPRLARLPDNPFPLSLPTAVAIGKTPYARFDRNDYSVPHTHVRRQLTLFADPKEIRILDGAVLIACHPRSYDAGAQIEDSAHIQALRDHKRRAGKASATDRLVHAVPASAELLVRAAQHGHALQTIVAGLGRLLERYGAPELEAAILEVLKLEGPAPHPNSVLLALEKRRERRRQPPPVPTNLPSTCWTRTSRSAPHVSPPMTRSRVRPMTTNEPLRQRAERLRLHGLLSHWNEAQDAGWAATLLDWEETERARRSLERRLKDARIGRFKPLADFDWSWPNRCDRAAIDALMALDFLNDAGNAVVVGPNGVGKSTIARNIAHQAVLKGHTALFTSAGQLLGDLAAIDSASALRCRLSHYVAPALLVIDEVGYLSYSNRHADMLFELISRRYEARSTLVTTNRPFSDWHEVFPGAACVVSLVDRLVHNADVIAIDGDSYRLKEAKERAEQRARQRKAPGS